MQPAYRYERVRDVDCGEKIRFVRGDLSGVDMEVLEKFEFPDEILLLVSHASAVRCLTFKDSPLTRVFVLDPRYWIF